MKEWIAYSGEKMDDTKETVEVVKSLMSESPKTEFGRGCTYCIGLFLKHHMMHQDMLKSPRIQLRNMYGNLWFNGSVDHIYDMEIPEKFPEWLKTRLKTFRANCIAFRNSAEIVSSDNVSVMIHEAEQILIDIDTFLLEVYARRGDMAD